ncbi:MAG: hypothetical protein Q8J65_08400, partial [Nitrosomonadales bacterium]|nr:hypothetical protein [Nitrosomonadales bacterium]
GKLSLQMFSLHQSALSQKHALLAMCVFLGLSQSGLAGPRDAFVATTNPDDKVLQSPDAVGTEQVKNLSGVSMEERMRLRMDLNHYSRTSDPIHTQIEDRRRLMSKGIQERYFGADKDNDGLLSLQEVVDSLPQVARHYNQVDLDGDGFISINELITFQARLAERQRAAELRIQEAREAELKEAATAAEDEVASKQTKRPKIKSKQAEAERKPAL